MNSVGVNTEHESQTAEVNTEHESQAETIMQIMPSWLDEENKADAGEKQIENAVVICELVDGDKICENGFPCMKDKYDDKIVKMEPISDDENDKIDATIEPMNEDQTDCVYMGTEEVQNEDSFCDDNDLIDEQVDVNGETNKGSQVEYNVVTYYQQLNRKTRSSSKTEMNDTNDLLKVVRLKKQHNKKLIEKESQFYERLKSTKYICHACGRGFHQKNFLAYHMKVHTGEKSHLCFICGRGFANVDVLTRHISKHPKLKQYPCNRCGKEFELEQLERHIGEEHALKKPYFCNICKKYFSQLSTIISHRKRVHDKNTKKEPAKRSCNICKKLIVISQLKEHKLQMHPAKKSFKCLACGEIFSTSEKLDNHLATHRADNDRKFPCPVCGENFMTNNSVVAHCRKVHKHTLNQKCDLDLEGNWIRNCLETVARDEQKVIGTAFVKGEIKCDQAVQYEVIKYL